MFYGINVYIIIKMPALLVLSVNNRYTELIRAIGITIIGRGKTFLIGCRFHAQVSFSYLASLLAIIHYTIV